MPYKKFRLLALLIKIHFSPHICHDTNLSKEKYGSRFKWRHYIYSEILKKTTTTAE